MFRKALPFVFPFCSGSNVLHLYSKHINAVCPPKLLCCSFQQQRTPISVIHVLCLHYYSFMILQCYIVLYFHTVKVIVRSMNGRGYTVDAVVMRSTRLNCLKVSFSKITVERVLVMHPSMLIKSECLLSVISAWTLKQLGLVAPAINVNMIRFLST